MKKSRPQWIRDIEDKSGGKPVLLVEGNSDEKIFSRFLDKLAPSWNRSCALFPVGQKQQLLRAFENYGLQGWAGIVDRDEWSPEYVLERVRKLPMIKVLPRFCLESYFCVPDEVWAALPSKVTENMPDGIDALRKSVEAALPAWGAHGAMWRVIRHRHRILIFESRFPREFDSCPVTDENEIRAILNRWHVQLDPDTILAEYQKEFKKALRKKPKKELLSQYVHGKKFFSQVIIPTLNNIFRQSDSEAWLERLLDEFILPDDMTRFLKDVLKTLSSQADGKK